jgi:hypothetical protein
LLECCGTVIEFNGSRHPSPAIFLCLRSRFEIEPGGYRVRLQRIDEAL